MWDRVEAGLKELQEYYRGRQNVTDSRTFRDAISNFFVRCAHLRDHLIHDPAVTLPKNVISGYFWNSDPLSLSGDFANTWKHHTRTHQSKGPPPRSVTVGTIRSDFAAAVVWEDPVTGVRGSRDVLVLAEQAVNDWRMFLLQHHML
jgi:hypothetical protein